MFEYHGRKLYTDGEGECVIFHHVFATPRIDSGVDIRINFQLVDYFLFMINRRAWVHVCRLMMNFGRGRMSKQAT